MKVHTISDRQRVLEVLKASFADNPTFCKITRSAQRQESIARILRFSIDYGMKRNGVYLSEAADAAAICFEYNAQPESCLEFFRRLYIAFSCFPGHKMLSVLSHLSHIRHSRPAERRFLYFWYLGSQSALPNSTRTLVSEIFREAAERQLDIYAETTLAKNKRVYERMGFECYREWYNESLKLQVWFMRKRCHARPAQAHPAQTTHVLSVLRSPVFQ